MTIDNLTECPATCDLEETPRSVDHIRNLGLYYCTSCDRIKECPVSPAVAQQFYERKERQYRQNGK